MNRRPVPRTHGGVLVIAVALACWPIIRYLRMPAEPLAALALAPTCLACAIAVLKLWSFLAAFQSKERLDGPAVRMVRIGGLWFIGASLALPVSVGVTSLAGATFRNLAALGLTSGFLAILGLVFIGFSHVLRKSLDIQNDWEGFV